MNYEYYLSDDWQWRAKQTILWQYAGANVAKKISDTERVIDIGCGNNWLKPLVKNLIGIDAINDRADIKIQLQDFVTDEKFDVAIVFGSMNNLTPEDLRKNISLIINLLTPSAKIFWRTMGPGWTHDAHRQLCNEFNFTLQFVTDDTFLGPIIPALPDTELNRMPRIYAEWVR